MPVGGACMKVIQCDVHSRRGACVWIKHAEGGGALAVARHYTLQEETHTADVLMISTPPPARGPYPCGYEL